MSQIGAIQILRALAALMVVFSHAQSDALVTALKTNQPFARIFWLPWVSGVDLFFVISGFIMVHASHRLFATPGAPGAFLTRRLIRIVPLYWIVTAAGLATALYAARLGRQAVPGWAEIASSFGFIPFTNPQTGEMRPLAGQGWTLNYEMFFYVVFAVFVRFQRGAAVAGVALSLALIAGLGALLHPTASALAYWSDPIIFEFALGMGLAVAWRHGFRVRLWMVMPAIGLALAILALDLDHIAAVPLDASEPNGFWRLIGCGLPMALLFGVIALAEPAFPTRSRTMTFIAHIGDASYALYLFHPLMVVVTRKVYIAMHLDRIAGFWPLVAADLAVAVAAALVIYRLIEKPVTIGLQRGLGAKTSEAKKGAAIARPQAG